MSEPKKGSCLCEGVSFTITGELSPISYCYCIQCRKTHGVMGPYTRADHKDIQFTSDTTLKWFKSSDHAERGFCDTCGASIFWHVFGSDSSAISAGTLDHPVNLSIRSHIYIKDIPDFHPIPDDGAPHFEESSSAKTKSEETT